MLGHIESYDERCQTGVVKYQDEFFEFHVDQWTSEALPKKGDDVDFDHEDGKIIDISLVGAYLVEAKPVKSQKLAAFLGIVFWRHRFASYLSGLLRYCFGPDCCDLFNRRFRRGLGFH